MENQKSKIKVLFMGTPEFAVPSLKALIEDSFFDIIAVVTQTDKKVGRQHALTESPVKELAKKSGIPVFQPQKIASAYEDIANLKPDIIIVIAYGQIIPKKILDIPKYGCVNIHGSLLPKYRGASCVQAAILNEDSLSGITIMKMDEGMDTGDIIYQESVEISDMTYAPDLYDALSKLSGKILPKVIKEYIEGNLKIKKQDNSLSSYAPLIKKEAGLINFSLTGKKIHAHIRAMYPWPGAFFLLGDFKLNIIQVGHITPLKNHRPGELFSLDKRLYLQAKDSALEVKSIQAPGKKAISGNQFIIGYKKLLS
jgi:methionyl-tRNA formyltransferase